MGNTDPLKKKTVQFYLVACRCLSKLAPNSLPVNAPYDAIDYPPIDLVLEGIVNRYVTRVLHSTFYILT